MYYLHRRECSSNDEWCQCNNFIFNCYIIYTWSLMYNDEYILQWRCTYFIPISNMVNNANEMCSKHYEYSRVHQERLADPMMDATREYKTGSVALYLWYGSLKMWKLWTFFVQYIRTVGVDPKWQYYNGLNLDDL